MLNAIHRLARSDAIRIVGVGIAIKTLKLSALFPSQRVSEVRGRVACIISFLLQSVKKNSSLKFYFEARSVERIDL